MIHLNIIFLSLSLPILTFGADLFQFLHEPQHDNVKRVVQLNSANADQFIASHSNGLVLILKDATVAKSSCQDDWAELSAQLLVKRNFTVAELPIDVSQTVSILGNAGDVLLYINGKQHHYYGLRSPNVLLAHIMRSTSRASSIPVIAGKLDKSAFDKVSGPKVIGFFMAGTVDYANYEQAASQHAHSIPFYVVHDRVVSMS